MSYLTRNLRSFRDSAGPIWVLAALIWLSIVARLDPAGSYPGWPQGPGLTVDEIFNVEQGVYLVEQARALGVLNLLPGTSLEAYRPENGYLPDHPPLGRWWLGVHHHLARWLMPPQDPAGISVTACARTGSATAFALTVALLGLYHRRRSRDITAPCESAVSSHRVSGTGSGLLAGLALVLMPRVLGHAHLAALESITNLTCTAAVLVVAAWWTGPAPPTRRVAGLTGFVFGLALLTKIQAILIPIPIVVWALWRWRGRAVQPLVIWGLTGGAVLMVLWPYLWIAPWDHLLEYLGRTTNRATLYCSYFGVRYADRAVPWHYPFVMFGVTVPVLLLVLGGSGSWYALHSAYNRRSESRGTELILACAVFPLLVFAIPGVAVYDGERLFLTVFPLWAVLAADGAARLIERVRKSAPRVPILLCSGLLILVQAAWNEQFHPQSLSYYNLLMGGRVGAERLGMELSYWGDGLTRDVLERAVQTVPAPTEIRVQPSLHPFQSEDLVTQSPILRRGLTRTGPRRVLTFAFRRRAELSDRDFARFEAGCGPLAGFRIDP